MASDLTDAKIWREYRQLSDRTGFLRGAQYPGCRARQAQFWNRLGLRLGMDHKEAFEAVYAVKARRADGTSDSLAASAKRLRRRERQKAPRKR